MKSAAALAGAPGGMARGDGETAPTPAARFDYRRLAGDPRDNSTVAVALAWIRARIHLGRLAVGRFDAATKSYVEEPDHPLALLWRRPSPAWSTRALMGAISDGLKCEGNAYLIKARDGGGAGQARELYWAPSSRMRLELETKPDRPWPVRTYWYRTADGREVPYPPRDVIHFRNGIHPDNPALGDCAVKRQDRNLAALNCGETYQTSCLYRGHAGTFLVPDEAIAGSDRTSIADMTPDEVELMLEQQRITRSLSREAAGSIYVASMPLRAVPIGDGPEAMGLDRILDRPEAHVIGACDLNPMVLHMPSSAATRTYNNYREAERSAWGTAIIPTQDLIAEELTAQCLFTLNDRGRLVGEWGDDPDGGLMCWWDRADVAELREEPEDRTTRTVSLFTGALLPRDRALAEGGFEPVGGLAGQAFVGEPTSEQQEPPSDDETDDQVDEDVDDQDQTESDEPIESDDE